MTILNRVKKLENTPKAKKRMTLAELIDDNYQPLDLTPEQQKQLAELIVKSVDE